MKRPPVVLLLIGGALLSLLSHRNPSVAAVVDPQSSIEERAVATLRDVMRRETSFVKVHAAEALLELGQPDGVYETFIREERERRDEPAYRVGVWRALARVTAHRDEHARWLGEIRRVALDPAAPDRTGAIETLAKLSATISPDDLPAFEATARSSDEGMALFSLWAIAGIDPQKSQDSVASFLTSTNPISRLRAAFILRHLPELSMKNRDALRDAARAEPPGTLTHVYATSSSFLVAETYGDADEAARGRAELRRIAQTREGGERQEACRAFVDRGTREDLPWLTPLLDDAAPGVRVAAALACAGIERRTASSHWAAR